MSRSYDDDHHHRRSSRERDRDRDRRHRSPSDEHRGRRDHLKPGIGKKAAEKSGGLFAADDWMCKRFEKSSSLH